MFGNSFWKVSHPNVSNNIPQMKSQTQQPYFVAGGSNQVPYYLGLKGNTGTQIERVGEGIYSSYSKVLKHRK